MYIFIYYLMIRTNKELKIIVVIFFSHFYYHFMKLFANLRRILTRINHLEVILDTLKNDQISLDYHITKSCMKTKNNVRIKIVAKISC